MKFAILAILLISSSLAAPADWEKYLVKIDLKAEPIKEEWAPKPVLGFENSDCTGRSNPIPEGNFHWLVADGVVIPEASSPAFEKCWQVPKGWTVEHKGIFKRQFFSPKYDAQIQNLYDNCNRFQWGGEEVTQTGVTSKFTFWRQSAAVAPTGYLKIQLQIPDYVRCLINAQTSRVAKAQYTKALNQCQSELNSATTSKTSLNSSLSALNQSKNDLTSSIAALKAKIEIFNKIINGQLKEDVWIATTSTNKSQIDKLKADNAKIEAQIKDLQAKLAQVQSQLDAQKKNKETIQNNIAGVKKNIDAATTTLNTEISTLSSIESTQTIKNKVYTQNLSNAKNLISQKNNLEQQIRDLQAKLEELNNSIEKANCDLVDQETELVQLAKKQEVQQVAVSKAKDYKTTLTNQVIALEKSDVDNDNAMVLTGKQKTDLENQITALRKTLSDNLAQISTLTANSQKMTKDYYSSEVVKLQAQITATERQLTANQESINTTTTSISTVQQTINTKTDCVANNTKYVANYNVEYDSNKAKCQTQYNGLLKVTQAASSFILTPLNNLNDNQTVETYLVEVKRTLHQYLDALPANPDAVEVHAIRRRLRRRMRRMRRMI